MHTYACVPYSPLPVRHGEPSSSAPPPCCEPPPHSSDSRVSAAACRHRVGGKVMRESECNESELEEDKCKKCV